ncbi:MAG TPA: sigma-70 family RNA polymerase sigma factor [Gammaproteobacteria bacterium]|nr:sigma-70 family RNA polymerase sigma factor [Gammaproteobacteria bacterium]
MGFGAYEADDDAALARRIIAAAPSRRDAAAEAELCRRLGPRIRLYGRKHLRSEAAAADLMQDVLILLLDKLREGAVRDPSQVVSFVLGTARQTVVDWRRSGARRTRLLEKFPLDLQPSESSDGGPEPIDAERLRGCLGALPERERAVLVMTFYDDRPADAVASELGLSAGNVRVIRHRGLERLRGCMAATEGAA